MSDDTKPGPNRVQLDAQRINRRRRSVGQHLEHEIEDDDKVHDFLAEVLPLVGEVVVCFNGLERDINSLLCGHISDRSDAKGLLVLHRMQFAAKVDLFERFSDDYHRVARVKVASYDGLVSALRKAAQLRNDVVHADWESTEGDGYTFVKVAMSEHGMEQEYAELSRGSLSTIVDTIIETRQRLDGYLQELEDAETAPRVARGELLPFSSETSG